MRQLLNDQEVLNFGFDDFNDKFSHISVQAKDLYIYFIDFQNATVVSKFPHRSHIIMKSIFYNPLDLEQNETKFQEVKTFIEDQEG